MLVCEDLVCILWREKRKGMDLGGTAHGDELVPKTLGLNSCRPIRRRLFSVIAVFISVI